MPALYCENCGRIGMDGYKPEHIWGGMYWLCSDTTECEKRRTKTFWHNVNELRKTLRPAGW